MVYSSVRSTFGSLDKDGYLPISVSYHFATPW
jgi:hypothetical protein